MDGEGRNDSREFKNKEQNEGGGRANTSRVSNWASEHMAGLIQPCTSFQMYASQHHSYRNVPDENNLETEIILQDIIAGTDLFQYLRGDGNFTGLDSVRTKAKYRLTAELSSNSGSTSATLLVEGFTDVWLLDYILHGKADPNYLGNYVTPHLKELLVNPRILLNGKTGSSGAALSPNISIRVQVGFLRRDARQEDVPIAHMVEVVQSCEEVTGSRWKKFPKFRNMYSFYHGAKMNSGVIRLVVCCKHTAKPELNPMTLAERIQVRSNLIDYRNIQDFSIMADLLESMGWQNEPRDSKKRIYVRNLRSGLGGGREWILQKFIPFTSQNAVTIGLRRRLQAWVENNARSLNEGALNPDAFIHYPDEKESSMKKTRNQGRRSGENALPNVRITKLNIYRVENIIRELESVMMERMRDIEELNSSENITATNGLGITSPTSLYLYRYQYNPNDVGVEHFNFGAKLCAGLLPIEGSRTEGDESGLYMKYNDGKTSNRTKYQQPNDIMFIDPLTTWGMKNPRDNRIQYLFLCNI